MIDAIESGGVCDGLRRSGGCMDENGERGCEEEGESDTEMGLRRLDSELRVDCEVRGELEL